MLTAGDEFGRTQGGNNNAYAQDNATTWLDWTGRDTALEEFVAALSKLRANHPALSATEWLTPESVKWLRADGSPMSDDDWSAEEQALTMVQDNITITFDPSPTVRQVEFTLAPTTTE
jgi:glycogen debranching enzyme